MNLKIFSPDSPIIDGNILCLWNGQIGTDFPYNLPVEYLWRKPTTWTVKGKEYNINQQISILWRYLGGKKYCVVDFEHFWIIESVSRSKETAFFIIRRACTLWLRSQSLIANQEGAKEK